MFDNKILALGKKLRIIKDFIKFDTSLKYIIKILYNLHCPDGKYDIVDKKFLPAKEIILWR